MLVLASILALSSCRRATDQVAHFAESTRSATEQLAFSSEQANEERERQIAPDVIEERNAPPLKLVERYETRQGPDGLFVYDTETHAVARLANQPQAGLTLDQANKAVEALSAADVKGQSH